MVEGPNIAVGPACLILTTTATPNIRTIPNLASNQTSYESKVEVIVVVVVVVVVTL